MEQNGGGRSGSMTNIYGISTEQLQQMQMDTGIMDFDIENMHDADMILDSNYGGMMDGSDGHSHLAPGQRQQYSGQRNSIMGMPGFGMDNPSDLDGFQFDPPSIHQPLSTAGMSPSLYGDSAAVSAGATTSMANGGGIARRRMEKAKAQRRASAGNIGLNTDFGNLNSGMGQIGRSPMYPMTATGLPMSMDNPYYQGNGMQMGMELNMSQPTDIRNPAAINLYSDQNLINGINSNMTQISSSQPMPSRHQTYPAGQPQNQIQQSQPPQQSRQQQNNRSDPNSAQDSGARQIPDTDEEAAVQKMPQMNMSDATNQVHIMNTARANLRRQSSMNDSGSLTPHAQTSYHNQPPLYQDAPFVSYDSALQQNMNNFSTGDTKIPGEPEASERLIPQYINVYSGTGFDMIHVLMKVATRPKPRINIGAVDLSCAFVVCDVKQHDVPIVYCSDMFERLTGYSRHEILGRNCRFLQAPEGRVESGLKRKYVDDRAVLHLKNMISQMQEAQISLINYRKGGQPFMNLLTIIPISWDTDEIRYYVGFQVDLVEQPTSITNKNPNGTYAINYQRGPLLPSYVYSSEGKKSKDPDLDRSVPTDEVSTVLSTIGQGESELSRRIWDKVLLENTDDVIHVLSLKGLFLYLSPSCKRILEYDPHELVGTALSSVCHPSDIVPVTRELKDTSNGAAVNVIFRIRRKHSGYTWFEAHGALHNEQGKSKKCIILIGRPRPVYALLRREVVNGFSDSELWTKISTTGMFLYVSQHAKSLLDRLPEELVGTSAQNLMRKESKADFGKALEIARTGHRWTFKHDLQNKRGQTLHAETTVYPGDAQEGQKPTFLIAQTRLLKMSRGQPALIKSGSCQSENSQKFTGSVSSASPYGGATVNPAVGSQVRSVLQAPELANGPQTDDQQTPKTSSGEGVVTSAGGHGLALGTQDETLAADDNVFDELKTTRSTSWQFELRQMQKRNRLLAEELQSLLTNRKKRKRRKGLGQLQRDCANCHTRNTPEWRRGPSGQRDLCNSCGLRYAKQQGRVSPRTSSQHSGDKQSVTSSPRASIGEKMVTATSQGSPAAAQKSPPLQGQSGGTALASHTDPDKIVEVEMPSNITNNVAGLASMGERTVPQTIQEGSEPVDEEEW